jgi:acetyl esterase/lipase
MVLSFPPKDDLLPYPVPRDFIDKEFAKPHGVSLEVRIWPAPKTSSSSPKPWVLWAHGGAYSAGAHYAPPSWVVPGFRERGFHVVDAAYRLSPHCGLEEQLDDLTQAFAWCREHLPSVLGEGQVDVERFAVGGDSAGGTLSTLLGFKLEPTPRCVIDVYGNTDLLDEQHWSVLEGSVYKGTHPTAEVVEELMCRDPSRAIVACPFPPELRSIPEKTTQDRWARPDFTYSPRVRIQTAVKDYMAQTSSNIYHLLRLDRFATTEEARAYTKTVSPVHMLDDGRASYPPTAFLHGEGDASVPVQFARDFEDKLRGMGVPTVGSYCEAAPHAFDMMFTGPESEGWDMYVKPVLDFVQEHV